MNEVETNVKPKVKRKTKIKGLKIETPEDKLSYQTQEVFYETKG